MSLGVLFVLQSFPPFGSLDLRYFWVMEEYFSWLKKRLPELVGVFLLAFLLGLVVFLYLRTRILEAPPALPAEEDVVTQFVNRTGNPIQKSRAIGKVGFLYQLRGSFPQGLNLENKPGNSALRGRFVLQGDELEREIPVLLWMGDGRLSLGRYEKSFEGDSRWTLTPVEEVASEIRAGEEVILVVEYELPKRISLENVPEYFKTAQQILDGLAEEFYSGESSVAIPENFSLVSRGIGVLR